MHLLVDLLRDLDPGICMLLCPCYPVLSPRTYPERTAKCLATTFFIYLFCNCVPIKSQKFKDSASLTVRRTPYLCMAVSKEVGLRDTVTVNMQVGSRARRS